MKPTLLLLLSLATLPPLALGADPAPGASRFAELDGTKIHYTDYGQGDVPLVFIHGWACDETVWNANAPALAQDGRCLTIDLPGHGQSDKPRLDYTMSFYARAIDTVLRDAKATSAVLVAHSNGVPVVRQFYREYPQSVCGLVLVDGPLRPFFDAAALEKFLGPMRGPDYAAVSGKLIDSITEPIPDEAERTRIRALMRATPQYVAVSEFENTAPPEIWKPDKIEVPVLILLAKQPGWSADYEAFVRELVPNLDYQVWENVSHFLMLDQPAKFNDAVRAFLKKHRAA